MPIMMIPSEALPEYASCAVRVDAPLFGYPESGPQVLKITLSQTDITIFVTLPETYHPSEILALLTVKHDVRTGGETLHVHIASALLYSHLDSFQGSTQPGKTLLVDPRLVDDPAIKRLAKALVSADQEAEDLDTLYINAICLALVTRLLSRQSDIQLATAGRHPTALQKWRLKKVIEYVDAHLTDRITLADLAAAAGLTRMHFAAQFRAAMGVRPREYILRQRVDRAQGLLRNSKRTLVDVALSVGFQTQAHFTTVFRRFADETPLRWRRANLGSGRQIEPEHHPQ